MTATRAIRLLSIVGTRPEAIKIAPVALAAAARPGIRHRILATGQHDALFDDAMATFGLTPDLRLAPVLRDPSPDIFAERLVDALEPAIAAERPDMVLVQGDTTSAYAAALAAHRLGVPVGHVEAGLRSYDLDHPWPEERNRVAIDRIAALLFAPTPEACANLDAERDGLRGLPLVTGNTGIDALLQVRREASETFHAGADGKRLVLLTCHRRESIREGLHGICAAARAIADRGDVSILCPVHSNPAVAAIVRDRLGGHPAIVLTGALSYGDMVAAMSRSALILTDSGGIQEEAPALGIPTLVLRDVTERPEGLASGNLQLVGTDPARIVAAATRLLEDAEAHAAMAHEAYPFGRGGAAIKILDAVEHYFSRVRRAEAGLPLPQLSIMDVAR